MVIAQARSAHAATVIPMVSSPAAAINQAGNAEVFARGSDGQIWHAWNRGGTNWSGWNALPGRTDAVGNPGVGRLSDGRLIVFTRTNGGGLARINQYSDGSWTPWTAVSLNVAGDPVVGHNQDGRVEAFWRGTDNHLYHDWQISGSNWSDVTALLNSSVVGNPSVDNDKDGRIEVFVTVQVSGQKNVLRLAQTSPNHNYGPNSTMLPNVTAVPTVTHNGDGRLEYFARGTGGTIFHSVETKVNATTWTKPANLVVGGKATPIDDHVVGAVSGTKKHLELFYRQPNGQLGHQWHTAATGNAWHVGIAMPGTSVTIGTTPSVVTNGTTVTVFWNDGFTIKHNELVGDTWRTPTPINNPAATPPPAPGTFAEILSLARREHAKHGIPVSVMLAQSDDETGEWTSQWWLNHNNPAGIGVTGAPGAGFSYPTREAGWDDYEARLRGIGELHQEQFVRDLGDGTHADPLTLLRDLEVSGWAAGGYNGHDLELVWQHKNYGRFDDPNVNS